MDSKMDAKLLILLLLAINSYTSCGAALRRTPKVYNALITTDENLTSSRAFPVIQPTIHESGLAHYPFGPYNPYGLYGSPYVRLGQPITPGLSPRDQLPYPLPQPHFPPQLMPRPPNAHYPGFLFGPGPQIMPTAPESVQEQPERAPPQEGENPMPMESQLPARPPTLIPQPTGPNYVPMDAAGQQPQMMPNDKPPLPLNENGLPPALIPLHGYPNRHPNQPRPHHLPPYGYNQYPLIYDPITGFREQYLPPYEYFPSNTFMIGPPRKQYPQTQPQPQPLPQPTPSPEPAPEPTPEADPEDEDDSEAVDPITDTPIVKNGSKSKDSSIPDVPPPPLPSGAKANQS